MPPDGYATLAAMVERGWHLVQTDEDDEDDIGNAPGDDTATTDAQHNGGAGSGFTEILSYRNPRKSAKAFLDSLTDPQGRATLLRWRGDYRIHGGSHYRPLPHERLTELLYGFLEGQWVAALDGKDEAGRPKFRREPYVPNRQRVNEILHALPGLVLVDDKIEVPAWRGQCAGSHPAKEYVACANGLLHLPTRQLIDHTPDHFNLNALGFNFDPAARAPQWDKFLKSIWPKDQESIDTLQEIMGYVVAGRWDQQKIFYLLGPKRSGKGTILNIITALLGEANVCSPSLRDLSGNFGLEEAIGKSAIVIPDARQDLTNQAALVERLLTLSSNDPVSVQRKGRVAWQGKLGVRIFIGSNVVLKLGDKSGVVPSRFVTLKLKISWFGQEDTKLEGKLRQELPGILNWALDGLPRLDKRGGFRLPSSAQPTMRMLEASTGPHVQFGEAWCMTAPEVGPDDYEIEDDVFKIWKDWCEDEDMKPGTKAGFVRDLCSAFHGVEKRRPRDGGGRKYRLYGLRLRKEKNG